MIMLVITCKIARVAVVVVDIFIDSKGRLMMIKDMLIQQISLKQLRHVCDYFKAAGYRLVSWMQGNFPIEQFGKNYWIPTWTR